MIFMVKRRGNILVEVVVALFILMVCFQITLKLGSDIYKSNSNRGASFLLKEGMNAVCSELKYNTRFEEINSVLDLGNYKLRYDKDFNNKISEIRLFDMDIARDEVNYIEIECFENNDIKMKLKITAKYKGEVMEQIIDKAPWMDEV